VKRIVVSTFFLVSILFACSSDPVVETATDVPIEDFSLKEVVAEDSLFSIDVLANMRSTNSIDDWASVQYSDLLRSHYLVVSNFRKSEIDFKDFQSFAKEKLKAFCDSREIIKESSQEELTIDGLDVVAKAVDVKEYGSPKTLSYWLGCINGKKDVYIVKLWTLRERKELFEKEANAILRSFKELN